MEGTIWARAEVDDSVETWMNGSTGESVVAERHILSPSRTDRLQRSVVGIVADDKPSTMGDEEWTDLVSDAIDLK